MKFMRIGPIGREQPVVRDGDRYLDLAPLTDDIDGAFLADDPVSRVGAALDDLVEVEGGADLRIGAPLARPSAIFCIGMNYAAHAAESGSPPPTQPVLFLKTPNTICGPDDDVPIPRGAEKTDWEVELGVVIGRRAGYLDHPDQSLDHVAGFLVANDVSERAFQLEVSGGQWSKGKISPRFSPLGPWLATPDEIDHQNVRLRSWVNGDVRQDSSSGDQIFDVATVVHHLSQFTTLEPGDLILTGTPEGVALSGRFPYLTAGDVVELEIDGLGRQRQQMVSHEEARHE